MLPTKNHENHAQKSALETYRGYLRIIYTAFGNNTVIF
jgi:hypothetical protein